MKTLSKQFDLINSHIKNGDQKNTSISSSGTYWHLDHILKVIIKVSQSLQTSVPSEYRPKFHFVKSMILLIGSIPRGKAKAPKRVLPPEQVSLDDLKQQLSKAIDLTSKLNTLDHHCYFNHPIFGDMKLKQATKFLTIHTEHHLKIINDILTS